MEFGQQYIEQITPIAKFLDAQHRVSNLEVEGRLGRIGESDEPFDTNISEEYHSKILEMLNGCTSWESNNYVETKDYFSNDKRFTETLSNKNVTCMKKKSLKKFDLFCDDGEFDIRISFAIEEPCEVKNFEKVKEKCKRTRTKKRYSFIRKDYKYELTEVISETASEMEISYEYEVEYNKTQFDDYFVVINKLLYKLLDASIYCEKGVVDHIKGKKLNLL
jgi:hypothetical protein